MKCIECEVLAPAGRVTDIVPLLENGADAIYVGLAGYSARPQSSDFTAEEIGRILPVIHGAGKMLFVAVNANVPGQEIEGLCGIIQELDDRGIDALII